MKKILMGLLVLSSLSAFGAEFVTDKKEIQRIISGKSGLYEGECLGNEIVKHPDFLSKIAIGEIVKEIKIIPRVDVSYMTLKLTMGDRDGNIDPDNYFFISCAFKK